MFKRGVQSFPYYLGVAALDKMATRDDRVCVLNILGGELRLVTPVSHAFSGGNVVFGTSPGRHGQVLPTAIGDIPVYSNVREGLDAGHSFNTGVVYLPPSGVRDGVAELVRVNPTLEKIVIITEKVSVHDAFFFILGLVARARHCAGVSYGPRQLRFPAANDTGDDGLAERDAVFVIAAGFGIQYGSLAARIVRQRIGEIARCIMDVHVLA